MTLAAVVLTLAALVAPAPQFSAQAVEAFERAKIGEMVEVVTTYACNVCSVSYRKVSNTEVQQVGISACTALVCEPQHPVEKFKEESKP